MGLDSAPVMFPPFPFMIQGDADAFTHFLAAIPAPTWGAIGVVGAAALAAGAAAIGHIVGTRGKAKADAGTLALGLVTELQGQVTSLNGRVTTLETERNAYRSWSHELFDWGSIAQTADNPRPDWPAHLPR